MGRENVTLTLSRDDVAFLHRKVAAEALMYCGRALGSAQTMTEARERTRLVDLAEALAHALDAGGGA